MGRDAAVSAQQHVRGSCDALSEGTCLGAGRWRQAWLEPQHQEPITKPTKTKLRLRLATTTTIVMHP